MNRPALPSPIRGFWRAAAGAVGAVVFPQPCLGCGGARPGGVGVCPACLRRLPRADRRAVAAELAACGAPPEAAMRACALWLYDDGGTVQRVQHALKFKGRPSLGVPLGRLLGAAVAEALPSWRAEAVAAVPLSSVRELERGYNQSDGLAAGCAAHLGARVARPLARTRATRQQARLSSAQRRENVSGAFALTTPWRQRPAAVPREAGAPAAGPLAGVRILLVDDVLTTGATLLAAAAPLREAGAEVAVAALAFAP